MKVLAHNSTNGNMTMTMLDYSALEAVAILHHIHHLHCVLIEIWELIWQLSGQIFVNINLLQVS